MEVRMLNIGIDWADDHHDVCVVDDQGKKLSAFRMMHNAEGFAELLEKIQHLQSDKSQVAFCLETSQGLLVEFLLDQGYRLYPVNPKAASRCRERYKVSGAKDDTLDAWVLANFLRTDRDSMRELLPSSDLAREIKILVQDRESLVRMKTRLINKLTAALKSYYPKALELFGDIQSHSALAFLREYPTPDKAKTLTLARLRKFLKAQGYSHPNRVEEIWNQLQEPLIPAEGFVVEAKSRMVLALVGQLEVVLKEVASYEKAISGKLTTHPDLGIFKSLPAAGATLQAQMLAYFGDNREVYPTFEGVQRQAGTCPITKQSGNMRSVYFRRACNHGLRNTLQLYAFSSLGKSLWARSYYDKKRKEGCTHQHAIRCLANVWAKIIHTLWKGKKLYDENVRLAQKMRQELHQQMACVAAA